MGGAWSFMFGAPCARPPLCSLSSFFIPFYYDCAPQITCRGLRGRFSFRDGGAPVPGDTHNEDRLQDRGEGGQTRKYLQHNSAFSVTVPWIASRGLLSASADCFGRSGRVTAVAPEVRCSTCLAGAGAPQSGAPPTAARVDAAHFCATPLVVLTF